MRKLVIEFVKEVTRNISESGKPPELEYNSFEDYVQPFALRDNPNVFLEDLDLVTLEFICFHKNWRDAGQVDPKLRKVLAISNDMHFIEYLKVRLSPYIEWSKEAYRIFFKNF